MKKILTILIQIFIINLILFSQVIDQKVAIVTLNKTQAITLKQLDQRYKNMKSMGIPVKDKIEVLDAMINEELFKQAAETANLKVNDEQVMDAIKKQLGPKAEKMTRDELESIFTQQTGMDFDTFLKENKEKLLMQMYLDKRKSSDFQPPKTVTEEEIKKYYEDNPHLFVRSEAVKISQIYIETIGLDDAEKQKALALANEIQSKATKVNFTDLVSKHSSDTKSRFNGGDIGYLQKGNVQYQQMLGKEFFDTAFTLKVGQISKVIETKGGYHIIMITEYLDRELLTLEDKITPTNDETVRDRIIKIKNLEEDQNILKSILEELTKKADIKKFPENIK